MMVTSEVVVLPVCTNHNHCPDDPEVEVYLEWVVVVGEDLHLNMDLPEVEEDHPGVGDLKEGLECFPQEVEVLQ